MASGEGGESKVVADLSDRISRNATSIAELRAALYGNPDLGQRGFRQEIEARLDELEKDLEDAKQICEDLRMERREELAERRGLRKAVGYTGITNLVTLATLLGLIYALWQGIFGG